MNFMGILLVNNVALHPWSFGEAQFRQRSKIIFLRLRGTVKTKWGKLTDDDSKAIGVTAITWLGPSLMLTVIMETHRSLH
jgi:hypothetical protein